MVARLLLAVALLVSSPLLAEETSEATASTPEAQGPVLADLLKNPAYLKAWQVMLTGEISPDWLTAYTTNLDGPPVPNIPVPVAGEPYTLGYVCQPNACEDNQLFVLFAPNGAKAWALMATASTGIKWLGNPDERIKTAINGALKK